jgi:hypothetical protein
MDIVLQIIENLFATFLDHYVLNSFVLSLAFSIFYPIAKGILKRILSEGSGTYAVEYTYASEATGGRVFLPLFLITLVSAAICALTVALVTVPVSQALDNPWFISSMLIGLIAASTLVGIQWRKDKPFLRSMVGAMLLPLIVTPIVGLILLPNRLTEFDSTILAVEFSFGTILSFYWFLILQ